MGDTNARTLRWLIAAAVLGTGCAHSTKPKVSSSRDAHEGALSPRSGSPVPTAQREMQRCELGAVYFAVDSSLIDEHARETILEAVQCFTHNGAPTQVTLTGAADPRGTDEYNLALGYRRAASVQHVLVLFGVAASRTSLHSVGEESAAGSDEETWKLDRRVAAVIEP